MPEKALIGELTKKKTIVDSDIIIVEDNEDTKQSTVEILKKNFNGDSYDPSNVKFYSSAKVDEIKTSLQRDISSKASQADYASIKSSVDKIIKTQSEQDQKDIELIIARDGCNTLDDRLERDKNSLLSRMLKKYKQTASGNRIYLGGFTGYGDVLVDTATSGNLIVASVNYFNIEDMRGSNNSYMDYSTYGFTYTQKRLGSSYFNGIYLPLANVPVGNYFFSCNLYNEVTSNDNGDQVQFVLPMDITVVLKYSDRTEEYLNIDIGNNNSNLFYFGFSAKKILSEITFTFPRDPGKFIEGAKLRFENVMISPTKLLDNFIEHKVTKYPVNGKQYVNDVELNNCEIYFEDFNADLHVEYYNDKFTTEYIIETIQNIEKSFYEDTDHCGRVTSYGSYNFFAGRCTNKNIESGYIEVCNHSKFMRNGKKSVQLTYTSSDDDINIVMELENNPVDPKYVTILMYVDKFVTEYMDDEPIIIKLVSDSTAVYPVNNYYKKTIRKKQLIQGWNSLKIPLTEFITVGSPNRNDINHVILTFANNANMSNKVIYLNSIIFNQAIKPTVLLGFNGVYNDTFTYLLPFMKSNDLECSVFTNSNNALSNTLTDSLIMYRLDFLDVGQYGCSPNKELLLKDDNYREQYLALKDTKAFIQTNVINSPISYSCPYGNMRPITVDLLKDIGFGIAKVESDAYCSFFSKEDMCIPSVEINNNTDAQTIKDKIDYAIATEQCIGISTYNVTDYGDEINAKKSVFEEVMNYLAQKISTGEVECMSYKTFYESCID